ncbi:MAG TPA: hypothetical protein VIS96_15660 [Terrimicrobiaceae bacterium]
MNRESFFPQISSTLPLRSVMEQLRHGFVVYDALYAWCRHVRNERHTWNPQAKLA